MTRTMLIGWRLRHFLAGRFGYAGLAGLLLLCAAAVCAMLLPHWIADTDAAQRAQHSAELRLRQQRQAVGSAPPVIDPFVAFSRTLPGFEQNANDLRLLVAQAELAKLDVGKADYHFASEAGAPFVKYDIVLPVKGSYAALRGFIAGVLTALPHAALADMRIERGAVTSVTQDARLRFTLIYRGA